MATLFDEDIALYPLEPKTSAENIEGWFSGVVGERSTRQIILPVHSCSYGDNVRKRKNIYRHHAIVTSCVEIEYVCIYRISTTDGAGVNEIKFKKMERKMKTNPYRTGTSKHGMNSIMPYCVLYKFMSSRKSRIPKEEIFVIQRLAQELTHHIYQRKKISVLSGTDDADDISVEMNRQDTSRTDLMKVQSGLMNQKNHDLTNSMKCQLCIDRNKAVNWCNTCGKNICSFCKLFHQKVWDVMEHDILPLRTVY